GDKAQARLAAKKAGAPVLPGSEGPVKDLDEARAVADEIGYPIILKASAGGGGRGMRIVRDADGLASAFQTCQTEARAAFRSSELYCEKFVAGARHVEAQVPGHRNGKTLPLGAREG